MHNSIEHLQKLKTSQVQIQKLFSFDERLFKRICSCGKTVGKEIYEHIETLERETRLQNSYLCCFRFCPLCNFYRVRNLTPQIVRELERLKGEGKELLFLTFTVPNCQFEELRETIQRMGKAFNRMTYNKAFSFVDGWIRTLEITFKKDQAHPHFHCIFAVDKDFFKHSNYLRTKDWSKLWTRCFKSKKSLIVDARAIRQKNEKKKAIHSAVAELSKYVIKSADLKGLAVSDFETIYRELKNLRFIVTSRNIKLDENEEQRIDESLWRLIEVIVYQWSSKNKSYSQKRIIRTEENISMDF